MQPNIRQNFKYIALLIGFLALFNVGIRVYNDMAEDCEIEKDKVVLASSFTGDEHGRIQTSLQNTKLCCPKVFIYDPRIVLQKAQLLHDKPLLLQHLDPINILETFDHIPYHGNTSIPEEDRVHVLTQLLRWMPQEDEVNQSLIIPHNDPKAKVWYSKDFVNMFSMRIALSQCVTTDPREAELFLVPMSVHTDHAHGRKTPLSGEWDALFASLTNYQSIFEHFTARTASKHVIFSSSFGHSRRSIGLWHPPFADSRVAAMQRVALGSECLISQTYKPLHHFIKSPQHVHSTPFTSLLSYPEDFFEEKERSTRAHNRNNSLPSGDPSSTQHNKLLLMSAFFGFHGRDKVRDLREKLVHVCESSVNCSTKAMKSKSSKTDRKEGILAIFETKKHSTFCLEPEGDWPTRQSMIQDIMLNCIPVFFSHNHLRLWPAFWGNFIDSVSVTFDYTAVMDGKVDVMDALQHISAVDILRKQKIMKSHKHQLNFLHVNDYMETGNNFHHSCSVDATNLLLFDLKQASHETSLVA
jgi:hypothetical protein